MKFKILKNLDVRIAKKEHKLVHNKQRRTNCLSMASDLKCLNDSTDYIDDIMFIVYSYITITIVIIKMLFMSTFKQLSGLDQLP